MGGILCGSYRGTEETAAEAAAGGFGDVDVDDDRRENNNILLQFDHDLDFSVSKVSNVYHCEHNGGLEIEIGSTHHCVADNDEESSIVQNSPHLLRLVKERKLRQRVLHRTKRTA